jgi:hypothetical protein
MGDSSARPLAGRRPWILGFDITPTINAALTGLALIVCSQLGGQVTARFGGGWRELHPGRMPIEA